MLNRCRYDLICASPPAASAWTARTRSNGLGVLGRHEAREHVLEEQHAERRHRARLDEPVDDQGEREAFRLLADVDRRFVKLRLLR